ncbi:AAA family ATPase [Blautia sp. RD014234]|nr:AAA family ATPase [Blautia parvula]
MIGPPGIGKTAIMEQAAESLQIGLVAYTITHHTRQSAIGLPVIEKRQFDGKEYTVTEYTMSEIVASVYRCMERTGCREGILFIDEINCVSETLAPTMLQFLQCKTFGSHKIPEGWVIVAAGNPPEYNKSVREFDMVTLDKDQADRGDRGLRRMEMLCQRAWDTCIHSRIPGCAEGEFLPHRGKCGGALFCHGQGLGGSIADDVCV